MASQLAPDRGRSMPPSIANEHPAGDVTSGVPSAQPWTATPAGRWSPSFGSRLLTSSVAAGEQSAVAFEPQESCTNKTESHDRYHHLPPNQVLIISGSIDGRPPMLSRLIVTWPLLWSSSEA